MTETGAIEGTPNSLRLKEVVEYGTDAQRGNLLGIQPFMVPTDYTSQQSFCAKIDGYLHVARQKGWLNEKTIVVLPEYTGTWLVAAGEKQRIYQAATIESAMRVLVMSKPFSFLKTVPFAKARDAVKYSLFRVKAAQMAQIYHDVFSGLAKKYGVTLVAGSIVLPSPEVVDGRLQVGSGELYNVSVVYKPDGTPYGDIVRKVFPIEDELPFTASALPAELPVYDTPAGKLGVLICADSWYPEPYQALEAKGAELVAVPSYLAPDDVWEKPWRGYSGAPAPDDVDVHDAQHFAEGEAWLEYSLAGRIASAGVEHGINVFLRGDIWDLGSEGHTIVVRGETVLQAKHVGGAAIVSSWL